MIDFEFEFQYAEEKQPTLQKVDGSIPAGRCVVLCGGSGCGKSTLINLILGLYQPTEGEIFYKGHPYSEYDRDFIQNMWALLFRIIAFSK